MTDFAKNVKNKLNESGMKQKDLVEAVREVYSGKLNPAVMSLAINGDNNVYPQVKIAIAKVLKIQF